MCPLAKNITLRISRPTLRLGWFSGDRKEANGDAEICFAVDPFFQPSLGRSSRQCDVVLCGQVSSAIAGELAP